MAKFRSAVAIGVALLAFPASLFAVSEESISIETLLKAGWQIAGYTSTLDSRSAFILFRHPDESYLVQCRASYDVTRTPAAHSTATSCNSAGLAVSGVLELGHGLH